MEVTKEEIQKMIKEALSEMNESDIVTKKGSKSWAEHKGDFKNNIEELLGHIEDDNYHDAENVIGKTIDTLKKWQKRIKDGLKDKKGDVLDEN
jgi:hypothetical protein